MKDLIKVIFVFCGVVFLVGCSTMRMNTLVGLDQKKEVLTPVIVPSQDANSANDGVLSKEFKKAVITDFSEITHYPAAAVLLTDKWYTRKQASSICFRVNKLEMSSSSVQSEFVTYFILRDNIKDLALSSNNGCKVITDMYDYNKSKEEAYRILLPHQDKLSIIKRAFEKSKIRGPFIVIYKDRNEALIVDLNQLGEKSTTYFVENWGGLISLIIEHENIGNPRELVESTLKNSAQLKEKLEEDKAANKVLWKDGAKCLGVVGVAVGAAGTAVGTGALVLTLGEVLTNDENRCAAILDVMQL